MLRWLDHPLYCIAFCLPDTLTCDPHFARRTYASWPARCTPSASDRSPAAHQDFMTGFDGLRLLRPTCSTSPALALVIGAEIYLASAWPARRLISRPASYPAEQLRLLVGELVVADDALGA